MQSDPAVNSMCSQLMFSTEFFVYIGEGYMFTNVQSPGDTIQCSAVTPTVLDVSKKGTCTYSVCWPFYVNGILQLE